MGLCGGKKNKKSFSKLFNKIFTNIKSNTLEFDFFILLSSIIELINKILIIDIVFSNNRDYLTFHFFFYFLSPTFYLEVINNKLNKGNNILYTDNEKAENIDCLIMVENDYKYDQISLLITKKFKSKIYTQNCYWNHRIFNGFFVVLIFISFLLQLLKENRTIFKVIKKFSIFMILFTFSSFIQTYVLIYARPILIQITNYYNVIKVFIVLDIFLLIIFEVLLNYYYFFFIYAFEQYEIHYFFDDKLFFLRYLNIHFEVILLIIRFNFKFCYIFKISWITIELLQYYIKINQYIYKINSKLFTNIKYYIELFIFSLLISKSISFFISFSINNNKFLEFGEFLSTICILYIFLYFSFTHKKYIRLTKIEFYLKKSDIRGLYGIYQIFNPLYYILISINHLSKSLDRERQFFFMNTKKIINKHLCDDTTDYELLNQICGENTKNIFKKNPTDEIYFPGNKEKIKYVVQILFHLLKRYAKITNQLKSPFNKYSIQIISYYKIILYFIIDEKNFRCEYIFKKLLTRQFSEKNDPMTYSIFGFFINYLRQFEKKMKDDSIEFILAYIKLNSKFFKLLKLFNGILKSTKHTRKEFSKYIFSQSRKIGSQLDKIIILNKKGKLITKFKSSPEYDKQKFVESVIFHSQYDKSLESFDFTSIDSLVDKNNYFILLFERTEFIVKKAPLIFTELTKIKSTKLKNKSLINIFPIQIRRSIAKTIKKNILSKQSFQLDSIIETYDDYIVYIRISFSRLPSFEGKIYMLGKLEKHISTEEKFALAHENGVVIKIGYYFTDYLGFRPNEQENNVLDVLGIRKSIKILKEEQIIESNYEKMFEKIRNNFRRNNGNANGDFYRNLQILKMRLSGKKFTKIKITVRDIYYKGANELYLIGINFEDIVTNLNNTKFFGEATIFTMNKKNFENSHSSIDSDRKNNNDSSWNVSAYSKDHIVETKNYFDHIGVFYNLFLIILAIALCIFLKINSNNFHQSYLDMFILREINSDYFFCQFFLSQMIILENSKDKKDQLQDYLKKNYNISFDFQNYYSERMKNESNYIIDVYNNRFKKFIENENSDKIYQISRKMFKVMEYNGIPVSTNYLDAYIVPLNYFYILSQVKEFYIEVPIINYNDSLKLKNLSPSEKQYLMTFPFNIYPFVEKTNEINYNEKVIFLSTFTKFKHLTILLLIFNLIFNIISLLIMYLSVNYSDKKMLKIEEKVQNLEPFHKSYLHRKIRIIKRVIINEMKATMAMEQLKKFSESKKNTENKNEQTITDKISPALKILESKRTLEAKSKNVNLEAVKLLFPNKKRGDFSSSVFIPNSRILKSTSIKPRGSITQINKRRGYRASQIFYDFANDENELESQFEKENIYRQFLKGDKYVFHVSKKIINVIVYFTILYIIYISISISLINLKLDQINRKRIEIENCDDLQDGILKYYLIGKYSILLNTTEIIDRFDYFGKLSTSIYNNFSSLMNYIYLEGNKKFVNYLTESNEFACENFLFNDEKYYYTLINICHIFPIFNSRIITVLSGFIKNIKDEIFSFINGDRSDESIINAFHSKIFQINNIVEIVYFMDFMGIMEYNYLLPDFKHQIDHLSNLLVILFIILIIIDVLNYLEGNLIILKDLDNTLNNYGIIEKFFIPTIKEKPKLK